MVCLGVGTNALCRTIDDGARYAYECKLFRFASERTIS